MDETSTTSATASPGARTAVSLRRLAHPAVLLLATAILAYGLLLPQMGFFWDELPMSWIRYELGPEAMTRYFSTNRPVWGLLYQATTHFLPQVPIYWEVFGLLWRWLSALLVWAIAVTIWPGRRQFAVVASLCFLLYPGFNQQWTSYLYSHFFIVLCFLLTSFLCTLFSIRYPRRYWPFTIAGLALSALNLWMMEYFYVLELVRPFLILACLSAVEEGKPVGSRVRKALILWSPYLLVFLGNILWRTFVFNNQIYQPTLLSAFRANPIAAAGNLIATMAEQLYAVSIAAWALVLRFPSMAADGPRTTAFYTAVVLLTAALVGLWLRATRDVDRGSLRIGWWQVGIGALALVFAGGPFWLTGLDVTIAYPANRFTLPFMLGVSILLAALMGLIPPRIRLWLAVGLIGLAAGRQALWAESYRHDWMTQKTMFWQMLWRAPGIAPHTTLLLNEGALPYYADNSLTGALNWIYDPTNRSSAMDYVLFYPTSRLGGTLPSFEPGQPITYDFISEVFTGSTSQVLAFYYQPPGCLRLLDPLYDPENHLISDASLMRDAAKLSSEAWVLPDSTARMPDIYGPEPTHGWCYYFERADLARQMGDWPQVVTLAGQAFALNDYPNDPVERFVFIEGYAKEGDWGRALELSQTSYKVAKGYVGPLLCRLWDRIGDATPSSPQKSATLDQVRSMFACTGA